MNDRYRFCVCVFNIPNNMFLLYCKDERVDGTKAKLTSEALQASLERLTQQPKGGSYVPASARDFNDWKRKHGVSSDTKARLNVMY